MLLGKDPKEEIGFAQVNKRPNTAKDTMRWVSWNIEWNNEPWNVKGKMGAMTLNWGDAIREVVFHVDEEVVKKWELELLDTEYTGIAYQEKGDANFQVC
ncbi:hypothetical protein Forpe1208_v000259 [Fusarium oxysporum f. sp. rapae]|uniref:Uncharacterized protein n=1 Tax=Fusarium oxysporum f. sp. rapae TaxID=485398 RepID=A0A8J5UHT7_FUSOX|nr:hypothetical protein Forpe1208_v000259 [Fusarium oxysporum f. sp. rapae]